MRTRWRALLGGLLVLLALLVAAFVWLVDLRFPSRPVRDLGALDALGDPERELNVVLVLIDMLRADRLSAYGYERPTSPRLDELVDSGVRFARAEAQSTWTKASMASLWTGVFPPRTGVVRFGHAVPERARMPAEIFADAGYVTAGLWRNGWVAPNFGFDQGFDYYVKPRPREEGPQGFARDTPGTRDLPGSDADVTHAALEFLRTYRHERFFLYLHYMDVHQYAFDREAAAQGFGTRLSDSYDASIHWVDRNVNTVVQALERLEVLDDTLVVIASDHGEAFGEHGYEGHAQALYREGTDVPLVLLLPFRLPEELVVEPLVRNVDIVPTLLDLAGLPPLEHADGRSLVPLLRRAAAGEAGEAPPSFAFLDQHWGRTEREPSPLASIREDGRRLLWKPGTPDGRLEAYDHRSDPAEQRNLEPERPAWLPDLRERLAAHLERPGPWGAAEEVEVDALHKAQLRALGYVVGEGEREEAE